MSEEKEKGKDSILNFKTFQVIIGIIIASGSFYFTVIKYMQSQPNIGVHVNSFDIEFRGETDVSMLNYRLDDIEDRYIDITDFWVIDMIEFFDSSNVDLSLSTINNRISETVTYYKQLLPTIESDLVFEDDYAYMRTDDMVEIYLEDALEYYFDDLPKSSKDKISYLYEEADTLTQADIDFIKDLTRDLLAREINGLITDLISVQNDMGMLIDPEDSFVILNISFENRSNNQNVIHPNTYLFISNEFSDDIEASSLYTIRLNLKRNINIERYTISNHTITSESISKTIGDFEANKEVNEGPMGEPERIMVSAFDQDEVKNDRQRFYKFFNLISQTANDTLETNFMFGVRDIHSKYWWSSGIVNELGKAQNDQKFFQEAVDYTKGFFGIVF